MTGLDYVLFAVSAFFGGFVGKFASDVYEFLKKHFKRVKE